MTTVELLEVAANWIAALGSIVAAVVTVYALKYARRAYEAQNSQLQLQQRELREDMIARKRLRLSHGPLLEVSRFEEFIEGLEVASGTVIKSNIVINTGALKNDYDSGLKFESEISQGYKCLAIHNYRSSVRLAFVKIRTIDENVSKTIITQVKKVKRFHLNFDWAPAQMWAFLVPDNLANSGPLKILFDFETDEKFFDRYVMEIDLSTKSIKQLNPVPLFEEVYKPD